jgi:hypothetical protein
MRRFGSVIELRFAPSAHIGWGPPLSRGGESNLFACDKRDHHFFAFFVAHLGEIDRGIN